MAGDLLITMGAGDVTKLAPRLLDGIEEWIADAPNWIERDPSGTHWSARIDTNETLVEALAWARDASVAVRVAPDRGHADDGFDGLELELTEALARVDVDAERARVVAGGGVALAVLARRCEAAGLSGLERVQGVASSVDTALRASGDGSETGALRDTLLRATLVSASGVREIVPADVIGIAAGEVVAEVELALSHAATPPDGGDA